MKKFTDKHVHSLFNLSCSALPCPLFRLQSSWWHGCLWRHGQWLQICSPQ